MKCGSMDVYIKCKNIIVLKLLCLKKDNIYIQVVLFYNDLL